MTRARGNRAAEHTSCDRAGFGIHLQQNRRIMRAIRTLTLLEGLRARRHSSSRVCCTLERRGARKEISRDPAAPNWKLISPACGIKLAPMPQKLINEEE